MNIYNTITVPFRIKGSEESAEIEIRLPPKPNIFLRQKTHKIGGEALQVLGALGFIGSCFLIKSASSLPTRHQDLVKTLPVFLSAFIGAVGIALKLISG